MTEVTTYWSGCWRLFPDDVLKRVFKDRCSYEGIDAPETDRDDHIHFIEQSDLRIKHEFDERFSRLEQFIEGHEIFSFHPASLDQSHEIGKECTESSSHRSSKIFRDEDDLQHIRNAKEKYEKAEKQIKTELLLAQQESPRTEAVEEALKKDTSRKLKLAKAIFEAELVMVKFSENLWDDPRLQEDIENEQASIQSKWEVLAKTVQCECGVDFAMSHAYVCFITDETLMQHLRLAFDIVYSARIAHDLAVAVSKDKVLESRKHSLSIIGSEQESSIRDPNSSTENTRPFWLQESSFLRLKCLPAADNRYVFFQPFFYLKGVKYLLHINPKFAAAGVYFHKARNIVTPTQKWSVQITLRTGFAESSRDRKGKRFTLDKKYIWNRGGIFNRKATALEQKQVVGPDGHPWIQESLVARLSPRFLSIVAARKAEYSTFSSNRYKEKMELLDKSFYDRLDQEFDAYFELGDESPNCSSPSSILEQASPVSSEDSDKSPPIAAHEDNTLVSFGYSCETPRYDSSELTPPTSPGYGNESPRNDAFPGTPLTPFWTGDQSPFYDDTGYTLSTSFKHGDESPFYDTSGHAISTTSTPSNYSAH